MIRTTSLLFSVILVVFVVGCGSQEPAEPASSKVIAKYSELGPAPDQPAQLQLQANMARRLVIKDADISIEVAEYDRAFSDIQRIVRLHGGYLLSSAANTFDDAKKSGQVTVRVPSERFDSTLQQFKNLSQRVEGETIRGTDVTEEFYDVSARLQNSLRSEQRILEILKSAKSVKDILEVERVLATTREEIERLEARKRFLSDQVALSTIKVYLHEPGAATSSERPGFWALIKDGLSTGWSALVDFFRLLLVILIVGIPAAIVILAIGLVVWRIAIRIRARLPKSE